MLEDENKAKMETNDLDAFRKALPTPRQMTDEEEAEIRRKIKSGEICMPPEHSKVEEAKEQAKGDEAAFMKIDKETDSIHKALGKQQVKQEL